MKNYRIAFLMALAGTVVFVAVLALVWWRGHGMGRMPQSQPPSAMQAPASSPEASMAAAEAPRAPVQLSPQRLQTIGVKFGRVERETIDDEIHAVGNITADETKLSYVQMRFSGYIQKVFANATYQYVRKGQPLFTIYSPDLVATEREYLVAEKNTKQVIHSTIPGVASGAASLVEAAADRLKQWQVPESEIARLKSTGQVEQELEIDSPVSGYITERDAFPSTSVQPETRLYAIADLSTVWVNAQVFQNDLAHIKAGDPAAISVDTYPGRVFSGRVDFIYPAVDMSTRTARVRIILENPDLNLSPGMFVNVALKALMGTQLVIPASGVLQSGTEQIVFVNNGDGYLEPRKVQLGDRAGDNFTVLKGLKEGEQIITSANFLIDSESQLQAAMGSYTPPPAGAGSASEMNAVKANLELASQPEPPRKGSNIFSVKLSDPNGAPVSRADVSVTLFMPAMPAMGMAAMRTAVSLTDKGSGLYEGSGELESGGTWQVTIVAKKNSQTIASKQLSVNATGGM
jgi:Cu(I)/Ag(I) efflux system membrane fusion protein/cobalt-zinc-cadmium efflux system membrane fusion protein